MISNDVFRRISTTIGNKISELKWLGNRVKQQSRFSSLQYRRRNDYLNRKQHEIFFLFFRSWGSKTVKGSPWRRAPGIEAESLRWPDCCCCCDNEAPSWPTPPWPTPPWSTPRATLVSGAACSLRTTTHRTGPSRCALPVTSAVVGVEPAAAVADPFAA